MIRFGVTPEINAIATIVLLASLTLVFAALRLSRRDGSDAPLSPLG
jgi:spermidine/putrescine transport system permease protein